MDKDLSILIPARNEEFLGRTIEDILKNKRGNTEIIVGLDGSWPEPGIPTHEDVRVVYYAESLGQRAITNKLAKLSNAKYLAKVDAHCAFDEGFDVKLMEVMQDDYTIVPVMRNLHVFDWVCKNGHRRYQGPSGKCEQCGEATEKDILWRAKPSPQSTSYCFDKALHFQYFGDYKKRPEGKPDQRGLSESMSLQGSFFMLTRGKYWELNICDEEYGSWGQQGTEVACKTWFSGGKVKVCHNTWYAHMFRTQGGDFSFPYPLKQSAVNKAREHSRKTLPQNKIEELVRRFAPVPDWDIDPAPVTKGYLYYTCNTHLPEIDELCKQNFIKLGIKPTAVSLNKDIGWGKEQVIIKRSRGPRTYHKQILFGLLMTEADIIYMTECDVMYDKSHFDFIPPSKDTFYYNTNVWKVNWDTEECFWTDDTIQVSGLVAYRDLLIDYYYQKVLKIENDGWDNHFEPGCKQTVGSQLVETWQSAKPNLDIRHDMTWTRTRYKPEEFRNKKYTKGWKECSLADIKNWSSLQGQLGKKE